ncbi:SIMPL domain-containing protein [Flavobacterium sp.]|uniref:SIMPL domain-containing protein n=1 Tax=Flavobacterium sp. TaxID=239 RepID=UPI003BC930B5
MKKIITLILLIIVTKSISQMKTFIDLPYIETSAKVDTLVIPDRIYLNISITEKDTKGKVSVEELESKMNEKFKSMGINVETQLSLNDLASNYKKYFLKQQDILKNKNYTLLLYDAKISGKVLIALEEMEISNVVLEKTEYSKEDEIILILKNKAIERAKNQANAMKKPLNQKVGNAIYISDLKDNFVRSLSGSVSGVTIRGSKSLGYTSSEFIPADIEFAKIKIETELNVKFKLE